MKKLWDWCWEMYHKYKEIINYLIVGGLTTVLALGVYYGSVLTFLDPQDKIQLQIANVLSWTAGVIFAYFTNRKFVFESKEENKLKEFGSFVGARIITLLMDMAIMGISVSLLHFNDKIMKLFSQVVITISNYIFSKLFVFKKKPEEQDLSPKK
jgi:putative flippase GtrA